MPLVGLPYPKQKIKIKTKNMENTIKSSMTFTFIVTVHINTTLNSSKKTTKKSTNNQLESFFLFQFSSKRHIYGLPTPKSQTPKANQSLHKPIISDFNINSVSCLHSTKNASPLSWLEYSYELGLDGMTMLEHSRCC